MSPLLRWHGAHKCAQACTMHECQAWYVTMQWFLDLKLSSITYNGSFPFHFSDPECEQTQKQLKLTPWSNINRTLHSSSSLANEKESHSSIIKVANHLYPVLALFLLVWYCRKNIQKGTRHQMPYNIFWHFSNQPRTIHWCIKLVPIWMKMYQYNIYHRVSSGAGWEPGKIYSQWT